MKRELMTVLDMDGLMADFEFEFCLKFGDDRRYLVNLVERYPDREQEIIDFVRSPNTYARLSTIPLGVDIARWLVVRERRWEDDKRLYPRSNVAIVTSRPMSAMKVTKEWLKKHKIPYHQFIINPDKEQAIKLLQPDIVVDDIIGVCQLAYNSIEEVKPVLVEQPWNDTIFFPRIKTLQQFIRIYEGVRREKLLTDFDGVELAEDLLSV